MHLSDCFMPLIAYTSYFLKAADRRQPSYEQVKADVQRLLGQSEGWVKKGLFSQEDYDSARFGVCAWVDEAILSSAWSQKGQWQKEQLQRIYYQTTDAGEEFFEKLNGLELHQREVREVYYLCLALGFAGRFCKPGDETLLDQLKSSNLKILMGRSVGLPAGVGGQGDSQERVAVSGATGDRPGRSGDLLRPDVFRLPVYAERDGGQHPKIKPREQRA
jgi:type VI secretion system protein ImpK